MLPSVRSLYDLTACAGTPFAVGLSDWTEFISSTFGGGPEEQILRMAVASMNVM